MVQKEEGPLQWQKWGKGLDPSWEVFTSLRGIDCECSGVSIHSV